MPIYNYEAANADGSRLRGEIEAPTRSIAVEKILRQGQTPLAVKEGSAESQTAPQALLSALLPRSESSSTRTVLLQEFSILLKAGLSVERALATLLALANKPRVRQALQRTLDGLRGGEPLSLALRNAGSLFPESMRKLIAAGEASGRLSEVMIRIADAEMRAKQLTEKVVSAMIYPALLVVTMIAVLTMIFTSVLPQLEPMFAQSGAALPWSAAALMGISHFLSDFGYALGIGLIAALLGLLYFVRQPATKFLIDRHAIHARYLLSVPQFYQSAQFCRNLAMLIDGGMNLNRALEITQQTITNTFVRSKLDEVIARVKHGRTLKSAMEEAAVFPRIALEFVAVGEETGKLGQMLNEAAEIFDADVQKKLDRLSALLLPAVTIVLGIIVAGIMSGVVSGIFAANDLAL